MRLQKVFGKQSGEYYKIQKHVHITFNPKIKIIMSFIIIEISLL